MDVFKDGAERYLNKAPRMWLEANLKVKESRRNMKSFTAYGELIWERSNRMFGKAGKFWKRKR